MTALALEQVAEIVQEMLKNDMITPNIAAQFSKLIGEQDMRLVAAYNQFMQTRNGTELIDSLLKVVIASVEGVPHKAPSTSSESANAAPPAPPAGVSKPASHTVAPPHAPSATQSASSEALLDKQDQKTVVNLLLRAQAINEAQFKDLNILIDAEDAHIARVFRQYEREKDVYGLMDSLKEYDSAAAVARVKKASAQQAAMEAVYGAGDEDDDNDDGNDEQQEDDDEDGEGIDEVSCFPVCMF